MKTRDIIEGLTILQKFRTKADGNDVSTEHDVLIARSTDKPVGQPDLDRLIALGWFQEDAVYGDEDHDRPDFAARHYSATQCWCCFV